MLLSIRVLLLRGFVMYPASKTKKEVDQFFGLLSSSSGYPHLLDYLSACMNEEERQLKDYAIAALTKADLRDCAQKQLGRHEFIKELLTFMQSFTKK